MLSPHTSKLTSGMPSRDTQNLRPTGMCTRVGRIPNWRSIWGSFMTEMLLSVLMGLAPPSILLSVLRGLVPPSSLLSVLIGLVPPSILLSVLMAVAPPCRVTGWSSMMRMLLSRSLSTFSMWIVYSVGMSGALIRSPPQAWGQTRLQSRAILRLGEAAGQVSRAATRFDVSRLPGSADLLSCSRHEGTLSAGSPPEGARRESGRPRAARHRRDDRNADRHVGGAHSRDRRLHRGSGRQAPAPDPAPDGGAARRIPGTARGAHGMRAGIAPHRHPRARRRRGSRSAAPRPPVGQRPLGRRRVGPRRRLPLRQVIRPHGAGPRSQSAGNPRGRDGVDDRGRGLPARAEAGGRDHRGELPTDRDPEDRLVHLGVLPHRGPARREPAGAAGWADARRARPR